MSPMSCWSRHPQSSSLIQALGCHFGGFQQRRLVCWALQLLNFDVEVFFECFDSWVGILSDFGLVPYQYTIRNHAHHWFQMMINKQKAKNWSRVSPAEPYGAKLWKPTSFGHVFAVNFIAWYHQLTESTLFTGKPTFRKVVSQHPTRVQEQLYDYMTICVVLRYGCPWNLRCDASNWEDLTHQTTDTKRQSLLIIHWQHKITEPFSPLREKLSALRGVHRPSVGCACG